MLEAGKIYTTRRGHTAKVYEVVFDHHTRRQIGLGAMFDKDRFVSTEHWDATTGRYHLDQEPTGMDIVGERNLADMIPTFRPIKESI